MAEGDGITQAEMIKETWMIVCRSTPGKPSLCERVGGVEAQILQLKDQRAKEVQPGPWQRFTNAALLGAGGATGAAAIAALLLGMAFKLNTDAAAAANRFQPREVQRAAP